MSKAGSRTAGLSLAIELKLGSASLAAALELPAGRTTALFGPSGAGKTSLLRVLSGVEQRAVGRIHHGDHCWMDSQRGVFVPAHERDLGVVFQQGNLLAHLTVEDNLHFAARRARRRAGPELAREELLAALDIEALLPRPVAALSGGEQRRVALARALLSRPCWLLLDEPLVGLDAALRRRVIDFLATLSDRAGLSTLLISHQPDEVARLADHVVLLEAGQVTRQGSAQDVLDALPNDRFESGSLLEAQWLKMDPELLVAQVAVGRELMLVPVAGDAESALPPTGKPVRLFVRAADVALARQRPEALSIRNVLAARILALTMLESSPFAELSLELEGQHLKSRITRAAVRALELREGQDVFALIKAVSFAPRMDAVN